jgi:hypothetical protein
MLMTTRSYTGGHFFCLLFFTEFYLFHFLFVKKESGERKSPHRLVLGANPERGLAKITKNDVAP